MVTAICERCGKSYNTKPAYLLRGRRFCSWECHVDFWHNVDVRGPDDCWPWKGSTMRHSGHGQVRVDGKLRPAHHVAFKLKHGYYPESLRHTCDNPPCCNDAHLLEGTQADNMADKVERGRQNRGETSPVAKLTEADVRAIRADPRTQTKIAADFGVTPGQISMIKSRKSWKHVP